MRSKAFCSAAVIGWSPECVELQEVRGLSPDLLPQCFQVGFEFLRGDPALGFRLHQPLHLGVDLALGHLLSPVSMRRRYILCNSHVNRNVARPVTNLRARYTRRSRGIQIRRRGI